MPPAPTGAAAHGQPRGWPPCAARDIARAACGCRARAALPRRQASRARATHDAAAGGWVQVPARALPLLARRRRIRARAARLR